MILWKLLLHFHGLAASFLLILNCSQSVFSLFEKLFRSCEILIFNWAMQKHVFRHICRQQRPRSACASTQSDQGIHYLLTESLDTTECLSGWQRPGSYFAHAQDDLNLRILLMFKGTFSLDVAQLMITVRLNLQ